MRRAVFCLLSAFACLPASARAADPFHPFEGGGLTPVPQSFQAWHDGFEKNGDYGESWFFVVQADDGGVLFAMLSITNLGLNTYDGTYEVHYYPGDGSKPVLVHQEHPRKDVEASNARMDTRIGKARAWGGGSLYQVSVDHPQVRLELKLENELPAAMAGDGRVTFYDDRSAEWAIGINTPRGRATGTVTAGGRSWNLAGNGYHDHGWATIKIPTFVDRWFTLRAYDKEATVVLHHQYLTRKFDRGAVKLGLFAGPDGKPALVKNFRYEPTAFRKVKKFKVPTAFELSFSAGGYSVKGTVVEERFLGSVDVLGQVSWPVRMAIKMFYSDPYMFRYLGRYELDVTGPDGTVRHLSGRGLMEANFF